MNTDKRRLKTKSLPCANPRPSAFICGQKSFSATSFQAAGPAGKRARRLDSLPR